MAALSDFASRTRVEDLRRVRAEDLAPILEEEVAAWREELAWDFTASAELVRRFVSIQSLSGFALYNGPACAGYGYYVAEDRKGLIGDLYVRRAYRTVENENLLLSAIVEALLRLPQVSRIESQLMMLESPLARPLPMQHRARVFHRHFMEARLQPGLVLPERELPDLRIQPWEDRRQEDSAEVIADAYQGHVDALINDQYRTAAGARRFLMNIVQYPGCGSFFPDASLAAYWPRTARMAGLCLASLVAETTGHITQVCVAREAKGRGAGYELMRRSLERMGRHRCDRVSLTVTASNKDAVRLYESIGFRVRRNFAAYVWE
ncbi:MAG: GNAT family N-acetyltransferase [Bryobacteraceae bacterium]|nr:GNAT family N-acetyltransferase [Bryobacteraceae bacterium]